MSADDLSLAGQNVASYGIASFTYDAQTFTATWTLNAPLQSDRLLMGLTGITDTSGNALDGEWIDGESTESGDGLAGGDFELSFNVLVGDVDRSGLVLGNDFNPVGLALGRGPGGPGYSVFADLDGSGLILGNDFNPIGLNLGRGLPEVNEF